MENQFHVARFFEMIQLQAEELHREFPEMNLEEIEADLAMKHIAAMNEEAGD